MGDPAYKLSYPVLAGTVIALSALRAGAFVKVVLSGEPGRSISTDGFIRNQSEILKTLLNYLGTGYSFGIHRLAETYAGDKRLDRPSHILVVSDYDMFAMLAQYRGQIERMTADGWNVHLVNSMEELLAFARQFSRMQYQPGTIVEQGA
jgi:hypothetical protein